MKYTLLLVSIFYSINIASSQDPPCRFAPLFTTEDLFNDPGVRQKYIDSVLYWEGMYHVDQAGINAATGLTYDGHQIDYTTGDLVPPQHYWSASSKESIHLGLLARALLPNSTIEALNFFHVPLTDMGDSKWDTGDTRLDTVLTILERKIASYEKWNDQLPGFGGFIPWVYVNDSGMVPIPNQWTNKVPGLDNGEMLWGIYAVIQTLSKNSSYMDLAHRYQSYFNLLIQNGKTIFYDGNGNIRSVTQIANTTAQPAVNNYESACGECFLNDPYEGELLAFFLDLYGQWDNITERDQIWINKRQLLQSVDYQTPKGAITCQRGWWFSSHEQWKYMFLPYVDVPINRRVFINGERARTWNSYLNGYPGLFASVTNVTQPDVPPNYVSAMGIPEIAFEQIDVTSVVTPYASFPLFLATDQPYGLAWYNNMLNGPRMQGPYGSTESVEVNGELICPVITWDSKITTVLAMVGGVYDIVREGLIADGKYDRFVHVVNREWSLKFPTLHGENLGFMLPPTTIPTNILGDFTTCTN